MEFSVEYSIATALNVIVTVLHTGIQERGDEDCDKWGI